MARLELRASGGRTLLAALLLGWAVPASGFHLLYFPSSSDPEEVLARTPRWSAEPHLGTGLHDGIQVATEPALAEDLGLSAEEVPLLERAVEDGFGMWASEALRFEIEHASPEAAAGPEVGAEIDVFAVGADHPLFAGDDSFGLAHFSDVFAEDRLLTNGRRHDGWVIVGADVYLNADRLRNTAAELGLPIELQAAALVRLLGHEVGHALGLGHANSAWGFDQDANPHDLETVDPRAPFAGLERRMAFDADAIMSNAPCDGTVLASCVPLLYQELQPDDRLGRDVLYPVPVPEPGATPLALAALSTLAALARPAPRAARPSGPAS